MIFLSLFITFFKIGLFGFGGGYGMLSLIQHETVERWQWLSSSDFTDIVAISQMTPGPIGINSATYIGYVVTGSVWGSIVATFTVVLPPFLLVLFASHWIRRHHDSPAVKAAFSGLRPVVVGLIASAALLLMNSENFGYETTHRIISIIICIISFCIVYFTRVHPILVILLAGLTGYLIF